MTTRNDGSATSDTTALIAPTMQAAILRLQDFWASRGAVIAQPVNTEVGAGTANPATALRVLGPEPWQVAYVEPSVRPDDARYGENPNRLQTHTQFQVILKPPPTNPQELYLSSLEVLGIDVRAHDIRFVEDNWASPALGAWGLGWEVWLDGLEITQFTYFQQAGGLVLDPVSVEMTYGLERILMALQGVNHFSAIRYNDQVTYGEIFLQSEYEMSRYYLDEADVEFNRTLFDQYADEAQRMLDRKLPVPAYQYVLKCSHTFNVLDARGAISTTERARSFGLMRRLTKAVSELWVERRAELDFPLGTTKALAPSVLADMPEVRGTQPLLVEIGVEELPHADVLRARSQVMAAVSAFLNQTSLEHGTVDVQTTPRRIVLTVEALAESEPDTSKILRGPKAEAAWDDSGEPTKALLGFLRGRGADLADVRRTEISGVSYAAVEQFVPGRSSTSIVSGIVEVAVRALRAERNMRWGDPELSYSRPLRWLVVLLGNTHIPTAVSALSSGTTTRLLRTQEPSEVEVTTAEDFAALLGSHGIVLDRDERRARVVEGAQQLASSVGGRVDIAGEAALIDEITDIVESPRPILGAFEEHFLQLPAQILTTVMKKHQRYLPVVDSEGALLPYFVTFANGACDEEMVRRGNESVIRARYADAAFFWRADLKVSPEEFRGRLSTLTFENRLGSFDDRVNRIALLAGKLSEAYGLAEEEARVVSRGAQLGKFDLASQMVMELSSLAGEMAAEYALHAGEPAAVAKALAEMEMPKTSSSPGPTRLSGAVLSLADRFDLLASMYAIGSIPTGTSDPFGVRRTALGIIRVLRDFPQLSQLSIPEGIARAAEGLAAQGVEIDAESQRRAAEFVKQRYELQLLDEGQSHALVRAVIPAADQPARADAILADLSDALSRPDSAAVVEALQRIIRILPSDTAPSNGSTQTPVEADLAEVAQLIEREMVGHEDDLKHFFDVSARLPGAVERYFEQVHVMDPDPAVRADRLGLLARVAALRPTLLDWTAL